MTLTLEQAQNVLARAARNVGRVYGVHMSVGAKGDELRFVDDMGDPVLDGFSQEGELEILCCTKAEIDQGVFVKLFAARSLYAALALKFAEILESEVQP